MITEISTEDLVDLYQIGWIQYREGDCLLRVKVVRRGRNKKPFLSHVHGFQKVTGEVRAVEYEDPEVWKPKARAMLAKFKEVVGEDHFYRFVNPHLKIRSG